MGHTPLEAGGNGVKESTYSVLSFPANKVPVQYLNFILAKWKRTLRDGNDYFTITDSDHYFDAYDRYTNHLLNRPGAVIRIAVVSDAQDVALGWSLIEGDILHYVFVQSEQRNRGIGRLLVPVEINTITHVSNFMIDRSRKAARLKHQFSRLKFKPF